MMKFLLGLLVFGSSLARGQDYYSPTTKDKEALARFPITLNVKDKVMTYSLPRELTGGTNDLSLNQDSDINGIRMFSGPHATAVCMGTGDKPGCVVTHKDLDVNREKAVNANKSRFTDNELQLQSIGISGEFLDHSGNEPIGFIGGLKPRDVNKNWKKQTGTNWTTFWVADTGGRGSSNLEFFTDVNGKDAGETSTATLAVVWSDYHATGTFGSYWFDLTFNAEMNKFEGTYGTFVNETVTLATIEGKEIKAPKTKRVGKWYGTLR